VAVQIAESIARGRALEPFDFTAKKQAVAYLDLKMTDRQFAMRYSADAGPDGEQMLRPYRFRFHRVVPTAETLEAIEKGSAETEVPRLLRSIVEKTGSKVIVIDNLSYFKRTAEGLAETARLVRAIRQLAREMGLSILLVAHVSRRRRLGPITADDLEAAPTVLRYIDNLFAIGHGRSDDALRYIKHVRPSSTGLFYGSAHVPVYAIKKIGGNFLGLEFKQQYAPETTLVRSSSDEATWELIRKVKELAGCTVREIAATLDISKTTVHRYQKMALSIPEPESEDREPDEERRFVGIEECIYERCEGCDQCGGRPGHRYHEVPGNVTGHDNCPDTCSLCGPRNYHADYRLEPEIREKIHRYFLDLRQWLIDGKQYERPVYSGPEGHADYRYQDWGDALFGDDDVSEEAEDDDAYCEPDQVDTHRATTSESAGTSDLPEPATQPEPVTQDDVFAACGCSPGTDRRGKFIWIEKTKENGDPLISYQPNRKRYVRWKHYGLSGRDGTGPVDGPVCPLEQRLR